MHRLNRRAKIGVVAMIVTKYENGISFDLFGVPDREDNSELLVPVLAPLWLPEGMAFELQSCPVFGVVFSLLDAFETI